jgi:hypothetical protein
VNSNQYKLGIRILLELIMSSKKLKKKNRISSDAKEPLMVYNANSVRVFNSFDHQADWERSEMAKLNGYECLLRLRQYINIAYQMHGFDPDSLPHNHSIKIVFSA